MVTVVSHFKGDKQREVKATIDKLIENLKNVKAHYQEYVDICSKQIKTMKEIRSGREPMERIKPIMKWHEQNHKLMKKALEESK